MRYLHNNYDVVTTINYQLDCLHKIIAIPRYVFFMHILITYSVYPCPSHNPIHIPEARALAHAPSIKGLIREVYHSI